MRIVRFEIEGRVTYGLIKDKDVQVLSCSPFDNPNLVVSLRALLTGETYHHERVKLLAPCEPSKYIGIGLNYRATVKALGLTVPKRPVLFLKPSTVVIGTDQDIVLPATPVKVVCEGELAVVIGRKGKNIREDDVPFYILGYTLTNDVMDVSKFESDEGNPTRSKAQDTFGPLGPCIETELDPQDLSIATHINGQQVQHGKTDDLIFSINHCVSFISHLMTLLPGDIIAMGSPPVPAEVKPGDLVEVIVEDIGTLRNKVVGPS